MAKKLPPEEEKRRIDAFKSTLSERYPTGSITLAAEKLGMSPSQLSRYLLTKGIKTKRVKINSEQKCIDGLKDFIARHKKIPSRDDFNRHSNIGVTWKSHFLRWDAFLEAAGVINDPAKILLLDIETAPNRAYVWGTWKQNINPDWIDAAGYVLCWTAKWLGSGEVIFRRLEKKNHRKLLQPMHDLLNEAHAVVHYNGQSFDIPTLNKEFLINGITPPSPYKQVDLLLEMRGNFRFPSNKLDYICKVLELGGKLRHEGPQLWLDCMEDKAEAWEKMESYNKRDVELLEKLYVKLLPWIKRHPNRAALSGNAVCPSCGSFDIKREGTYTATQLSYEQYHCGSCGVWFRGTKSITPKGQRFSLTA